MCFGAQKNRELPQGRSRQGKFYPVGGSGVSSDGGQDLNGRQERVGTPDPKKAKQGLQAVHDHGWANEKSGRSGG